MSLTEQQKNFFESFGYLSFPGLFAVEAEAITQAFEDLWAEYGGGHYHRSHDHQQQQRFREEDEECCAPASAPWLAIGPRALMAPRCWRLPARAACATWNSAWPTKTTCPLWSPRRGGTRANRAVIKLCGGRMHGRGCYARNWPPSCRRHGST